MATTLDEIKILSGIPLSETTFTFTAHSATSKAHSVLNAIGGQGVRGYYDWRTGKPHPLKELDPEDREAIEKLVARYEKLDNQADKIAAAARAQIEKAAALHNKAQEVSEKMRKLADKIIKKKYLPK